jgi:hypothetical protein
MPSTPPHRDLPHASIPPRPLSAEPNQVRDLTIIDHMSPGSHPASWRLCRVPLLCAYQFLILTRAFTPVLQPCSSEYPARQLSFLLTS